MLSLKIQQVILPIKLLYNFSDGDQAYSSSAEGIKAIIAAFKSDENVKELTKLYEEKKWRLHHKYKPEGSEHESSWLSYAITEKKDNVLVSHLVTVDEESLLQNHNYKTLFSDPIIRVKIIENYKEDYVLNLTNEELIKAFLEEEHLHAKEPSQVEQFDKLRGIFNISHAKKADKEKEKEHAKDADKDKETPKEGAKADDKVPKEEPKATHT